MSETLDRYINDLGRLLNEADAIREAMQVTVTPEGRARLAEIERELAELIGNVEEKVDAVGTYMLTLQRREETCKQEGKELAARAGRWKARHDWLKTIITGAMGAQGFKKLEGCRVTMTRVAGRDTVSVDELDAIPNEYVRGKIIIDSIPGDRLTALVDKVLIEADGADVKWERVPDKAALKVALGTTEVEGASMDVGPASLRVYRVAREGEVPEGDET